MVTDEDFRANGWDIHYINSDDDDRRVRDLIDAANPVRSRWRDHPEEFSSCTPAPSRASSPTTTTQSIDSSAIGTNVAECGEPECDRDGLYCLPAEDELDTIHPKFHLDSHVRSCQDQASAQVRKSKYL